MFYKMAYFSYSLIPAINIALIYLTPSYNLKPKCHLASPFSGKQSHVTFFEIPGQNKKEQTISTKLCDILHMFC
jgi:hypothetical protein